MIEFIEGYTISIGKDAYGEFFVDMNKGGQYFYKVVDTAAYEDTQDKDAYLNAIIATGKAELDRRIAELAVRPALNAEIVRLRPADNALDNWLYNPWQPVQPVPQATTAKCTCPMCR